MTVAVMAPDHVKAVLGDENMAEGGHAQCVGIAVDSRDEIDDLHGTIIARVIHDIDDMPLFPRHSFPSSQSMQRICNASSSLILISIVQILILNVVLIMMHMCRRQRHKTRQA